ncbi:MAG: thermonuclease family protein [Rhodospirillaceae bacterium]|nr:thermonuclease family protein [Rhodospirillaceae bacterium]
MGPPESSHKGKAYFCGLEAMRGLVELIGESPVRCIKKESDRYGRLLAQCFSDNTDLGAEQVRQGWAVAYRKYTRTYVAIEERAREARKGMGAGAFEMPWNWRRKNR